MNIRLEKAVTKDAYSIFNIQVEAFTPLLHKYHDYQTSPANESVDRVLKRIEHASSVYFKIMEDDVLVGAIRVVWNDTPSALWISPIFILPTYQGKGVAQAAMKLVEAQFPQARSWELATIQEEVGNCYLYEKLGYVKTGQTKALNEHATLIFYKRECS